MFGLVLLVLAMCGGIIANAVLYSEHFSNAYAFFFFAFKIIIPKRWKQLGVNLMELLC